MTLQAPLGVAATVGGSSYGGSGSTLGGSGGSTLGGSAGGANPTPTAAASWVFPEQYGAVGNDIADDLLALKAAVDSGHPVWIWGTYRISSTLLLQSGAVMEGPGSIKAKPGFDPNKVLIQAIGKADVRLRGFKAWGDPGSKPVAIIQLKTCTNCRVENMDLRYASHEGVSLNQSTYDCVVSANLIRDIAATGTGWGVGMFWDIRRCKVTGNSVFDCDAYGILIDDGTVGQADNLPCFRNVVKGNTIETSTTGMWGIGIEGSMENLVEGNTINCISTYGIDISPSNSTTVFGSDRNIVKGNFVRAVNGIRVSGVYNRVTGNIIDAADSGIILDQGIVLASIGNVVRNNTIRGLATSGNKTGIIHASTQFSGTVIADNEIPSAGQWGILIQAGSGLVVTGNHISNTQKEGIRVAGTVAGVKIRHNEISNAGLAAAATYGAITLDATAALISKARITDNDVDDATGFAWAALVFNGGAGTFANVTFARNRSLNAAVPDLLVLSGATVLQNDSYQQNFVGGAVTPVSAQDDETIIISATSNVTINSPGQRSKNCKVTYLVVQDGVGGRTVTFDANHKKVWSDVGNTLGKQSSISFIYDGASWVQRGAQSPYV